MSVPRRVQSVQARHEKHARAGPHDQVKRRVLEPAFEGQLYPLIEDVAQQETHNVGSDPRPGFDVDDVHCFLGRIGSVLVGNWS